MHLQDDFALFDEAQLLHHVALAIEQIERFRIRRRQLRQNGDKKQQFRVETVSEKLLEDDDRVEFLVKDVRHQFGESGGGQVVVVVVAVAAAVVSESGAVH